MSLRVIWQYMGRSVTKKILYGPQRVRILPYDPQCHELFAIYYTLRFYFPYLSLLTQPVTILLSYTLRFYFPYLSLLAQPVNITLYGPGLDCLVYDSVPERYLHYYFR